MNQWNETSHLFERHDIFIYINYVAQINDLLYKLYSFDTLVRALAN